MATPMYSSSTVVPLADRDRQTALRFAQQQATLEKAMQVYRNTLAVLAAKHCLDILEIPTDVTDSDCWNPFSRMAADVADLLVMGVGRLECRPVSFAESHCYVPGEVWEDRISYLVVQFDPPYQTAAILGFVSRVTSEQVPLAHLQSLEEFLIHLEGLSAHPPIASPLNHLSQWLTATPTDATRSSSPAARHTWQPIATIIGKLHQPSFAFRSFQEIALDQPERIQQIVEQLYASQQLGAPRSLAAPLSSDLKAALVHLIQTTADEETRWKAAEILWSIDPGHPASGVRRVLDLGLLLAKQPLVLMVAMLQAGDRGADRLSVLTRVYPLAEQGYLPPGLQLAVLDANGTLGLETQARERDNYIQLKLCGAVGEQFSIRLRLEPEVITEYFVI